MGRRVFRKWKVTELANETTQENNPFKEMEISKWGKVKEIKE